MTLQQLKIYLQTNGPTTLSKLSQYFTEDPKQIMCMAEHYIAKGKIFCEQKTPKCGIKCNACIASNLVQLKWN